MKKGGWKWALGGAAIALLIVYGLDTADGGISNVYGPVGGPIEAPAVNANGAGADGLGASGAGGDDFTASGNGTVTNHMQNNAWDPAYVERQSGSNGAEQAGRGYESQSNASNERLPGVPYETDKPTVDRLADGAAGVLQTVSSGGIKLFVSMFDGIMD